MLTILSNGDVYPCCAGWLSKPVGNVLKNSVLNIWNGPEMQDVRASVLDGSFRYCTRCPYMPGPSGFLVLDGKPDLPLDRIRVLKLDYDPTCNLICKGCRKYSSIHWANLTKAKEIHGAMLSSETLEHVDFVYVTGAGDPFASLLYRKFLHDLPSLSSGKPFSCPGTVWTPPACGPCPRVLIHTNGLLFTPRAWEKLGETRDRVAGISVSVDAACEETYRLNRGGSWDRLLENLRFISGIRAANKSIVFTLYFVVQANNFKEMPEFIRLAEGVSASTACFIALQNWGTFTGDEYLSRAVHLPCHPQYQSLCDVLDQIKTMKVTCDVGSLDQIVK